MNIIYYNGQKINLELHKVGKMTKYRYLQPGGEWLYLNSSKDRVNIECSMCSRLNDSRLHAKIQDKKWICCFCRGKHFNGFKGKKHTQESKDKIGLAAQQRPSYWKGRHHTPETKQRLSQARKGKGLGADNPFYGRHHTNECKAKLSTSTTVYLRNLSENEKNQWKKKISNSLRRFQDNNPEYTKEIRLRACRASHNNVERYKINKLERRVWNKMQELNLDRTFEYGVILNYYQFDFGSKQYRILLEVHGDYWHGHPDLAAKRGGLNKTQIHNRDKDAAKQQWAKDHNMELYVIWESDVKNNNWSVLEQIQERINAH